MAIYDDVINDHEERIEALEEGGGGGSGAGITFFASREEYEQAKASGLVKDGEIVGFPSIVIPPAPSTYTDLVYEYYGVDKEEYPFFVYHIPTSNYWGGPEIYFYKNINLSKGNGFMRNTSQDYIQIKNSTTMYVSAFNTPQEAINSMMEKLPNTFEKVSIPSGSTTFRNSVFVISTNFYADIVAMLGTTNMIDMDVDVEV